MCRHFSLRLWIPRYSPLVWQQIAGKMRVMYYVCWSRNYVLLEVCFAAHCRSFIVAVIRPRSLFSSPPFRSLRSGNCIMNGALLSAQRLTPEPFPFRLTSTTERRREKKTFSLGSVFFLRRNNGRRESCHILHEYEPDKNENYCRKWTMERSGRRKADRTPSKEAS